jgi:tetratricopeptide (TPR) repeat protein
MFRNSKALSPRGVAAIALVVVLMGCDSPEKRARGHFERGVEFVAAEEFDKARIEFQNAQRLTPDDPATLLQLARIYERNGDFRRAVSFYIRVTELDRDNLEAHKKLATLFLGGNAIEEARDHAEDAFTLAPEDPEVLATRGAIAYRLGDTAGALDAANTALTIDPDLLAAHMVIISDMVANARYDDALTRIDSLLAQKPNDNALNFAKLRVLAQKNDEPALEAHLIELADRNPDSTQFREALVRLYISQQRFDKVEAELRKIAEARPGEAAYTLDIVRLLAQTQGTDAARAELERAIAAGGPSEKIVTFRLALSQLEFQAGDEDAARAVLRSIIAEADDQVQADRGRIALAGAELAGGDADAARTLADVVLEHDAENVDALAIRARLQIADERPDDAIITLRKALNIAPQNVRLLMLEAEAQQRIGNLALVGERLGAATRVSEYAPEIALRYAAFLSSQDRASAAENVLSETARRHPSSTPVLTRLAELRLGLGDFSGADAIAEQVRQIGATGDIADRIIAASLASQGQINASIDVLERVVEDSADGGNAVANLVASYVRSGAPERAIALLDGLLADNPANVRAVILRAEMHLLASEIDQAESLLRTLPEIAPDSPDSYVVLSRFLYSIGKTDDAIEVVRTGLEVAPDSPTVGLIWAQHLEQTQQFDEAIAVYERLYDANPGSAVLANNFASLVAEFQESNPDALARARRISRRLRDSDIPHFQDTYGWIAYLSGEKEEARTKLAEAAASLPDNPLVRYHYGRVLASLDEVEQARTELNAALQIDPAFPKADSAREILRALDAKEG